MLIISSLLFVSSCQRDAVPEIQTEEIYIDLRSGDPGDWCDGGQSDPNVFFIVSTDCRQEGQDCYCNIKIVTNPPTYGLDGIIYLSTTLYNFDDGTGPAQGTIYYGKVDESVPFIYNFSNVKMTGSHFRVEYLPLGCNVFRNPICD